MVVRIDEASLRDRVGHADLDGSPIPLDPATLRRMAADADIIPAVLGTHGEVLDWGRARRLFTKAQRLALTERDGGCAFCGAPPAWTEVHHIRWWGRDTGPTDLANGILLCRHCHHTIHTQHWDIHATPTSVHFTPPATIDPTRTPRLGGRA
ncbi:HNH endonuclease signature motif containing protein, partial [Demequina sp. SYSU T00068]